MMVSRKSSVFLVLLAVSAQAMPHDEVHVISAIRSACDSLSPAGGRNHYHGHGAATQTNPSPYTITISAGKVKAGEKVTVTINGNENNSFKGFMVQARDNLNHKLGKFVAIDENSKTLTCDNTDDTITQKSVQSELPTVSFEWIAPDSVHENVVFYFTVVKSRTEFWVKLPSFQTLIVEKKFDLAFLYLN